MTSTRIYLTFICAVNVIVTGYILHHAVTLNAATASSFLTLLMVANVIGVFSAASNRI